MKWRDDRESWDPGLDEEPDPSFEAVIPNKAVAGLWFYSEENCWFLDASFMDERGGITSSRRHAPGEMTAKQAQGWAEQFIEEVIG